MNVSITVVATKTLMAGRCRFSAVVDINFFEVPRLRVGGEQHSTREYQCTAFTSGLSQLGLLAESLYEGYSRFVKYVPLRRSCQHRASTSTKAQSSPMIREAVDR